MRVKFWGTRGSIPTSGPQYIEFGGNTPCLEVEIDSTRDVLVLESGTGIRELGAKILETPAQHSKVIHLFLTHAHWDHIQGFPFFVPAYVPGYTIHIYCTKPAKAFLAGQMSPPFFPVGLDVMQAKLHFHQLSHDEVVEIGEARVSCIPLPHPQESTGFRIDHRGRSFVLATDTEHQKDGVNEKLVSFSRNADALIYDAQYTPDEYSAGKQGWGHSTYEEGVRVVKEAGVKKLVLFSHDPSHSDEMCRRIEQLARELFPETIAARQRAFLEF